MVASDFSSLSQSINFLCSFGANNESVLGRGGEFYKGLFWKNHVNKNQGWEPVHQKYKAKENTSKLDTTQKKQKNKTKKKQINNKNQVKTLFGPLCLWHTT